MAIKTVSFIDKYTNFIDSYYSCAGILLMHNSKEMY